MWTTLLAPLFRSNLIGGSELDPGCSDTTLSVAPLFRFDPIGGFEPDPGCLVTTRSLYQNHLSNTHESDFNLGRAHKHLQIQCNSIGP